MNSLHLELGGSFGVTVISNMFLDRYLTKTSGSFLKVYLCLLRHTQSPGSVITLSGIADFLEESEKDIIRALNYWEKEQLLRIIRDTSGTVTGICLEAFPPAPAPAFGSSSRESASELAAAADLSSASDAAAFSHTFGLEAGSVPEPASVPGISAGFEKPDYSEAQIAQLTENDEVKWMLNVIEVYLERLLKPMDIQLILYLYESLSFPADLILYLYEYCVSRNKKNPSYVEAVALAWAKDGINTVELAEAAVASYTNGYQTVNKAFGLNRAPGEVERRYIQRWFQQFGHDARIIEEACSRSLLQTGKPDFKYADKILENWKKEGVNSHSDIAACDARHAQKASRENPNPPGSGANSGKAFCSAAGQAAPRASSNRFNAFPQRNYSGEALSSMEQRLLQKNNTTETR